MVRVPAILLATLCALPVQRGCGIPPNAKPLIPGAAEHTKVKRELEERYDKEREEEAKEARLMAHVRRAFKRRGKHCRPESKRIDCPTGWFCVGGEGKIRWCMPGGDFDQGRELTPNSKPKRGVRCEDPNDPMCGI